MTKSALVRVKPLKLTATYESLKAWQSAVDDWLFNHV